MKPLYLLFLLALVSQSPGQVFADSPDKEAREAQKRQFELERESAKREREQELEDRKRQEEMDREERKHREEMAREERKHFEEMGREERRYVEGITRDLDAGERGRLESSCAGSRSCQERLIRDLVRDRSAQATGVVPGSSEDALIRLGADILIDRTLGQ